MKIIFLDIDGVLNSNKYYEDYYNQNGQIAQIDFEEEKIKLLGEVIKATGAKVVMSSTWRFGYEQVDGKLVTKREYFNWRTEYEFETSGWSTFKNIFKTLEKRDDNVKRHQWILDVCDYYGIELIDKTDIREEDRQRGLECLDWMKDKEIENYVVVDDDSFDITPYIDENHFVHTDVYFGLTPEKAEEIIKKLNREEN